MNISDSDGIVISLCGTCIRKCSWLGPFPQVVSLVLMA